MWEETIFWINLNIRSDPKTYSYFLFFLVSPKTYSIKGGLQKIKNFTLEPTTFG